MPVLRFSLRPPTAHPLLFHVYVSRAAYVARFHSHGRLVGDHPHDEPSGSSTCNKESWRHGHHKSRRGSRLWRSMPFVVLGFMPIVCFGLGTWQMQRLKWKVSLIDDLEDKLARDPMVLPRNIKCVSLLSWTDFFPLCS